MTAVRRRETAGGPTSLSIDLTAGRVTFKLEIMFREGGLRWGGFSSRSSSTPPYIPHLPRFLPNRLPITDNRGDAATKIRRQSNL